MDTDVKLKSILMYINDGFYPLQESGTANAPETLPQEVESAVNDENERQMEERRKEEEKHQVVENQLKRQGKYNHPNCCPFFETVYLYNDDTHVYMTQRTVNEWNKLAAGS